MLRLSVLGATFAALTIPALAQTVGDETVCFVPGQFDCASVAIDEIGRAQRTIEIQAYGFTQPDIAQALIQAHQRGVQVRLIVDKTAPRERGGKTLLVAQAGIPVWVDYEPRIAHNKVIVIDDAVLLQGSYNWTTAADHSNAENLLVSRNPALADLYRQNFESRLAASEPLAQWQAEESR